MILHSLRLQTNERTLGVSVDSFRKAILSNLSNIDKKDIDKILFHLNENEIKDNSIRRYPYILFGKPNESTFYIYGYEDEGKRLLKEIKKSLPLCLDIKNREFNISNIKEVEYDSMPKSSFEKITYYTSTPILLFSSNSVKKVEGIVYNKNISKDEKDSQLQEFANILIRRSVKHIFKEVMGKSKEVFENIEINWKEFKLIVIQDKNSKKFAIVGEFESNWHLPKFIGNRNGAGFGKLTTKRTKLDKKVIKWEDM